MVPIAVFSDESEALHLRRIVEFMEDEEFPFASSQALQFLEKYPQSRFSEEVHFILGSVYLKDKLYGKALEQLNFVHSDKLSHQSLLKKLPCFYALKKFSALLNGVNTVLAGKDPIAAQDPRLLFYYLESTIQLLRQENIDLRKLQFPSLIPYYEELLSSQYRQHALWSLAEVYETLDQHQKAADTYLELAKEDEKSREVLVYRAALMLEDHNKERSLELFDQVVSMHQSKEQDANYHWAKLLFDLAQYETLLQADQRLHASFPDDLLLYLDNLLGRSAFIMNDYSTTVRHLKGFLKETAEVKLQYQTAIMVLGSAAYNLHDVSLMNQVVQAVEQDSFDDFPRLIFLRGLLHKHAGERDLALKDFDSLNTDYHEYYLQEDVLYAHIELLYFSEQWQASMEAIDTFLQHYPSSLYGKMTYRYLLNVAFTLLESDSLNTKERTHAIEAVYRVLQQESTLTATERETYHFKLSLLLFQDQRYEEALSELRSYLKAYPSGAQLDLLHFLMAICYEKVGGYQEAFAFHAEEALNLNPNIEESDQLHLHLFNHYVDLAEKAKGSERHYSLASKHLYSLISSSKVSLKQSQLQWLGNYYFQRVQGQINSAWDEVLEDDVTVDHAEKAIKVFETILKLNHNADNYLFTQDTLTLEREVYQLALTLKYIGQYERSARFLQNLLLQYQEHPEWAWKYKSLSAFSLAGLQEHLGKDKLALELYETLLSTPGVRKTWLYAKSQLQSARLLYHFKQQDLGSLQMHDILPVLEKLKNLQIRKSLVHEPVHLEAALDYADMRVAIEVPEKRNAFLLQLLKKAKERFSQNKDIPAKDYHASRELMPEKNHIYQAYMMLLDAKIAQLQAKEAEVKGRLHEADGYRQAAKTLYSTLLSEKFAVSKYLVQQAKEGLVRLGQNYISEYEKDHEHKQSLSRS